MNKKYVRITILIFILFFTIFFSFKKFFKKDEKIVIETTVEDEGVYNSNTIKDVDMSLKTQKGMNILLQHLKVR